MKRMETIIAVGVLFILALAGLQLGKSWSESERIRASAYAEYHIKQADALDQKTDDLRQLNEMTRVARAKALALVLTGGALGLALAGVAGVIAFGLYVVQRAKVRASAPLIREKGDVVVVYVHPRKPEVPSVTLCFPRGSVLPASTTVIDGNVTRCELSPGVELALVNAHTQEKVTAAVAKALDGVVKARARADVLGQILYLFREHGRHADVDMVLKAKEVIQGEGRVLSAFQR